MNKISKFCINHMAYILKRKTYEPHQYIIKQTEICSSMYIILNGVVEVHMISEEDDFVFETLRSGTVINHRSFLTEDPMLVNLRTSTNVELLELTNSQLHELMDIYDDFKKKIMQYQHLLLK